MDGKLEAPDCAMQRFFKLTNHHLPLSLCGSLLVVMLLGGCGIFGPAAAPTPTAPAYAAVPTFTPTPKLANLPPPTDTPAVSVIAAAAAEVVTTTAPLTPTQAATLPTVQVITPTNTPAAEPRLIITGDAVNVRSGPATTFETVGTAVKGGNFQLLARNAQGDWWQICCLNGQPGWVFGELATVENTEGLAVVTDPPTPVPPTPAAVAEAPTAVPVAEPATPTSAPAAPAPAPVNDSSAGDFNPEAQYQIVHFKVLGLNENNGGIRDSQAQHHIFLTVLDQGGNGLDGVVVENLVGEKGQIVTGSKGPGKAEVTMYYEPFKLRVLSDGSGPVTSQISNQMGLAFPHLPDLVGKLGGLDYEYAVCPTIDVKCQWPIQAVHFSYEITFQKVK